MNSNRERLPIKLQIVSLIFIFISTVLIQVADNKISKHDNLIARKTLSVMNLQQMLSDEERDRDMYRIYKIHKVKIKDVDFQSIYSSPWLTQEVKDIYLELENKSINENEYYDKIISFHKKRVIAFRDKYNNKVIKLNAFRKGGTPWQFWRNSIFIPFQLLLLCLLAFGYYRQLNALREAKS